MTTSLVNVPTPRRRRTMTPKRQSLPELPPDVEQPWVESPSSPPPPPPPSPPPSPGPAQGLRQRVKVLRDTLQADLMSCDAMWTLFVAAALSYRYETSLRPFPPHYVRESAGISIDALIAVINETPKLPVLLLCLADEDYHGVNAEVVTLLHWVLVEMTCEPRVRSVSTEEQVGLLEIWQASKLLDRLDEEPTQILELCHRPSEPAEPQPTVDPLEGPMEGQAAAAPRVLAFHGGRLDTFYSLLSYGFSSCRNVDSREEMRLVLHKDLGAALKHSPYGAAWGASNCGSLISCVALCDFADHPTCVERKKHPNYGQQYVVRDLNAVRLRYLLFYGSRLPRAGHGGAETDESDEDSDGEDKNGASLFGWVRRHKYAISLGCYLLLLGSCAAANSGSAPAILAFVQRKIQILVEFGKRLAGSELE